MQKDNPLLDKSLLFAARIVKLNKQLTAGEKSPAVLYNEQLPLFSL